ncbi:hypothetical protein BGW39_004149 [Mortierella sp. 14UC]|nr:hypothetical protein BGW39_004149 [Mortierella sp. 14UC]
MAKRFSPLILFTDSQVSTIPGGHAAQQQQQQQQARHLTIPSSYEHDPLDRERDSRRMVPPVVVSLQSSSHTQHNPDMDMDIDIEHPQRPTASLTQDKQNGPQALEDYRSSADTITNAHTPTPESSRQHSRHPSSSTDQKPSSPISMATKHQDRNETTSSSSGAIVSPPSSYSSNASSSMDALAKTLSPARVDIHRKRIQRMLQQNSLLWWELVRYTRNLERSEREIEQEKEQEEVSSASGTTTASTIAPAKARALHLYHHHHHHHHHHPSLPPLHPQQQALSRSLVLPSKGSSNSRSLNRSHPYDSAVHREQSYPTQRPRWPTSETGDHMRPDQLNSSQMEHDGFAEERAGAAGDELERERLPSKYSSTSQSPSPVSTPPPTQQNFDVPLSKRYGEEPLQEELSSAFQHHRDYYPHSRRHRHNQEGQSSYSNQSSSHQLDHYQLHSRGRRYDAETSQRYPAHPTSAASHPDSRYDMGIATPTTSTSKRLPPVDSSRVDVAPAGALNAVYSSGPSSTASSPRSREHSSVTAVHQNSHHRGGQQDPRYHTSFYPAPSHHEPAPPNQQLHHQRQNQSSMAPPYNPRRPAHSPSEYPPHGHHTHHHQPTTHHPHNNGHQLLTSRPSLPPHAKIEPLPRPVPVKPASFVSPSGTASHSPAPGPAGHSITPSSASTSGSPVAAVSSSSRTTPPIVPTGSQQLQHTAPSSAATPTTGAGVATAATHSDPNNNNNNVDPNRKRRGNLPKSVTHVLKSWLVQNAIHPYPTEEEKMRLSEATKLSMNQISNWFINARRRILQPILHEAAAAAVAGTDAPVENVLIVRKGKGSRMHVEMEGSASSTSSSSAAVANGHPTGPGAVAGGPGGPRTSTAHHHQHHLHQHNTTHGVPAVNNNNHEAESNEESASLASVKIASHSSSPQPPQIQPQPILSS